MIRIWLRRIALSAIAGLIMLSLLLRGRLADAKARARRLQDDLAAEQTRRDVDSYIQKQRQETEQRHRAEQRESDAKLERGERDHLGGDW